MKVIGRKKVAFKGREGDKVEGMNLFCSYPIEKDGDGYAVEKVFLSARKLETLDFIPDLDDEIHILYNRFGKVENIKPAF